MDTLIDRETLSVLGYLALFLAVWILAFIELKFLTRKPTRTEQLKRIYSRNRNYKFNALS